MKNKSMIVLHLFQKWSLHLSMEWNFSVLKDADLTKKGIDIHKILYKPLKIKYLVWEETAEWPVVAIQQAGETCDEWVRPSGA